MRDNSVQGPRRQLPRWSDLGQYITPRVPKTDPVERRLDRAHTIGDLRAIARRRTPRSVFDYVDGAAEQEIGIGAARRSFRDVRFHPHVLRDVSQADPSTEILGGEADFPLILAPTGFTRMMQYQGERAVAPAAARAGVPYALSTMGTTSLEDVAELAPRGRNWFQLYLWKDRAAGLDLVQRAWANGYDTLVLTVDTPIAGARLRDVYNGLTIPPSITPRTFADMSLHPAWWMNLLTTEPLKFASLQGDSSAGPAELVNSMFDPGASFDDLAWLRENWPGKLVVKGIQNLDDAKAMAAAGADGIVLSNHGGRQLDRATTPLSLLAPVADALGGECEIILDTGIVNGADIVAAVAGGATACMVGRAYLYGLMAGGRPGVSKAIAVLREEYVRTMRLLGVSRTADLRPEHVTLP